MRDSCLDIQTTSPHVYEKEINYTMYHNSYWFIMAVKSVLCSDRQSQWFCELYLIHGYWWCSLKKMCFDALLHRPVIGIAHSYNYIDSVNMPTTNAHLSADQIIYMDIKMLVGRHHISRCKQRKCCWQIGQRSHEQSFLHHAPCCVKGLLNKRWMTCYIVDPRPFSR